MGRVAYAIAEAEAALGFAAVSEVGEERMRGEGRRIERDRKLGMRARGEGGNKRESN